MVVNGERHRTIKVCKTLKEAKMEVDKMYNLYIEIVEDKKKKGRK